MSQPSAFTPLARWLLRKLDGAHLSPRDASEKAGLSHGMFSHYIKGNVPSPRSCKKIADFFGEPEELVLQLAGHIKAPEGQEMFLRRMAEIVAEWTDDERETLLRMAREFGRQEP